MHGDIVRLWRSPQTRACQPCLPQRAPPTDDDRARSVDTLQHAVGAGRLTLGEFTDRVDAVLAAQTQDEMAEVLRDLPKEPVVGSSVTPTGFSVFGDVKLRGRWRLRERVRAVTVFGDLQFDLREAVCSSAEVRIVGFTVFGDVEVIVPEGVEAELSGITIFGDRKLELAAVSRSPQTPLVLVRGTSVFGDLKVRSLAPGESASAWRRALHRWHGGHSQQPPSALPPGH